jgi:two-component system, LytTR family, response regulator
MRILIVDDSRLARRELQELLSKHSQYEVVGEAVDVASALAALNECKPDVLLLDIHLPDGSGFDVLEQTEFTPKVIFTTAYEQHALRAFEVNALDYLLKPITEERLLSALERISLTEDLNGSDSNSLSCGNNRNPNKVKQLDEHVFIREGERCHFVKYKEIRHICVEGNYVRVFFRDAQAVLLRSLNYVEQRLDPSIFFRANRQQIINLNFIERVEPWIGDGLQIIMRDQTEVIASRRQARELVQRLDF